MLFFEKAYAQFLKLWLHFLKLYTQNHKTHTACKTSHLAKANTLKTILTLLKIKFLHINSTHKHKTISQIHAKLHTDVKNVKHCSSVSFACSESNGVQEFVIVLACISRGENRGRGGLAIPDTTYKTCKFSYKVDHNI